MAYMPGHGATLKVTISATPTIVAQGLEIGDLERTKARIDVSGLESTFEVIKMGIKRANPVPFTAWWDPSNATHAHLLTSYANTVDETWLITEADAGAATIGFTGTLSMFRIGSARVDQYVQVFIEITLTSDITVTP